MRPEGNDEWTDPAAHEASLHQTRVSFERCGRPSSARRTPPEPCVITDPPSTGREIGTGAAAMPTVRIGLRVPFPFATPKRQSHPIRASAAAPFLFRRFLPTVRTRYAAGGFVQRRGRSVGSGAESGPRRTMRLEVIRVSRGGASAHDGDRTPISHCAGFRQGYAVGSRSSRNSEAGSVPVTRSRSRARVHATYSRWRSVL